MTAVKNPVTETATPSQLKNAWAGLKQNEPQVRARNIAQRLDVSEGELVACRVGDNIIRLQGPWNKLFHTLPTVGRVMVLTRNESCVHEKKGSFQDVMLKGTMGAIVGGPIDLRVFLNHFVHGYAVTEESRSRVLESLQFFDGDGTAVHKIYRLPDTKENAWQQLIQDFSADEQTTDFVKQSVIDPLPRELEDGAVDVASLRAGWRSMGYGPHEFYGLLKRHQVTRLQAMQLVGDEFAREVGTLAVEQVLERASQDEVPIMVFTGSSGMVQIHSGVVNNIKRLENWLNVLDEDFNLHLRADHIAECWLVKKPVPEGSVTSLEVYDSQGNQIVQFFGARKPGIPELESWRALTEKLVESA